MKTNLSKWFSIRLSNAELLAINGRHWDSHNSIEHLRINETPSEWKVLMNFGQFKEYEL